MPAHESPAGRPRGSPESGSSTAGVAAVDRALACLDAVAELTADGDGCTLAALARHTGLYKSTLLRLLASLIGARLVQRGADDAYRLGPQVGRLASAWRAGFSPEALIRPVLREVVAFCGESAALHTRQGETRLCAWREESNKLIRDATREGDLLPLASGAGGRVLMAFDGTPGRLHDQLRRDYVCALVGDRSPELAGVSAPVFGEGDRLVGALTITGPSSRLDLARATRLAPWLRQRAARLSQSLGAPDARVRAMLDAGRPADAGGARRAVRATR